jgi:ribosomal protein S3AE
MAKPQAVVKGKKSWHPLVAPAMFRNVILGETAVYEPSQMMGKRIEANLMNLTGDIKRQNVNVSFQVTEVKDGKGYTSVMAFTMIPSSVKRMVRRRSDRVDISFACETADNKIVRIKPLLITRGNTTSVILRKLYRHAVDYVLKQVKKLTYEQLLNELVSYKFQTEMRQRLGKIYPLKTCDIRSLVLGATGKILKVELPPETHVESQEQPAEQTQESA